MNSAWQYLQAGQSELAVAAFRDLFNTEQHSQSADVWEPRQRATASRRSH